MYLRPSSTAKSQWANHDPNHLLAPRRGDLFRDTRACFVNVARSCQAGGGMKPPEQIKQDIEAKLPGTTITVEGTNLIVLKEHWFEVAKFLKTHPEYSLDYLSSVTGVDYKEYLEVAYHLYSLEKKGGPLAIKVRTDREKGFVPSVTPIWRSAEFQEREAYDLVGIHFEGHPDLRRILMWDEFQYHPLRKDYVQEDQDRPL